MPCGGYLKIWLLRYLRHQHTTIDVQSLTSNIACLLGSKEQDDSSHIVNLTELT